MYTGTFVTEARNLESIINIATSLKITKLLEAIETNIKDEQKEEMKESEDILPSKDILPPRVAEKRAQDVDLENWTNKKLKVEPLPMLQNILTQFPLNQTFLQNFNAKHFINTEKNSSWQPMECVSNGSQPETLGQLQSLILDAHQHQSTPTSQLTNILTAAAKLKQVAEQAISKSMIAKTLTTIDR